MKKISFIIMLIGIATVQGNAQGVSYTMKHDATKLDAIEGAYAGKGSYSALYFTTFHKNYAKTANATNKTIYTTESELMLEKQIPYAEKVDTLMKENAEFETIQMADRNVNAIALTENTRLDDLQSEIDKRYTTLEMLLPGSNTAKHWKNKIMQFANARSSLNMQMPNSERQRAYNQIYAEMVRANAELNRLNKKYWLKNQTDLKLKSNARLALPDSTKRSQTIQGAKMRFLEAGWGAVPSAKSE